MPNFPKMQLRTFFHNKLKVCIAMLQYAGKQIKMIYLLADGMWRKRVLFVSWLNSEILLIRTVEYLLTVVLVTIGTSGYLFSSLLLENNKALATYNTCLGQILLMENTLHIGQSVDQGNLRVCLWFETNTKRKWKKWLKENPLHLLAHHLML